jgi:hypothetical protein
LPGPVGAPLSQPIAPTDRAAINASSWKLRILTKSGPTPQPA